MALRAEIQQRKGKKPVAALDVALASFSTLQFDLLNIYADSIRMDSMAQVGKHPWRAWQR